jgi:RNA polymerase sigma-70 factor (ECF subfamily)
MCMTDPKPDSGETQDLLLEIKEGNSDFGKLFARHRNWLRRAVEMRFDPALRARVDPSDVVQEAQIEAFRRLPDFLSRQPMPFHLWLRKMALERLIMARRKHMDASCRAVGHEFPLPDGSSVLLGQQLLDTRDSPSQQVGQAELVQRVRVAVGQLREADREILLMRTFESLSYAEIACVLEIDSPAARKRYGRALIRLRALLKAGGISESQV